MSAVWSSTLCPPSSSMPEFSGDPNHSSHGLTHGESVDGGHNKEGQQSKNTRIRFMAKFIWS
jgi:hypothetical protein